MSEDTRQLLAEVRSTRADDRARRRPRADRRRRSIALAGIDLRVDHTPGHTKGSVLFRTRSPTTTTSTQLVFSGDVLFAGSIGRTDLPGGSPADMLESLRTKVATLPDSAVVLPGHGPQTTIARERATNPYLRVGLLDVWETGAAL